MITMTTGKPGEAMTMRKTIEGVCSCCSKLGVLTNYYADDSDQNDWWCAACHERFWASCSEQQDEPEEL
ncbi:MAG: hypothetical protein JWP80_377 [Pseudomonas sp.]|nr:hypothetical protein [Pseudomonas sp.]